MNLFGREEGEPYPIYVSKERFEDNLNFLMIREGENKRYVFI